MCKKITFAESRYRKQNWQKQYGEHKILLKRLAKRKIPKRPKTVTRAGSSNLGCDIDTQTLNLVEAILKRQSLRHSGIVNN